MKFYITQSILSSALCLFICFLFGSVVTAEEKVPEIFQPYFKKEEAVSGEIISIVLPEGINEYFLKIQKSAAEKREWFNEFSKKMKPGMPFPWHENLGLTKEEYDAYLKLWNGRSIKMEQPVRIRLEEPKKGEWMLRISGRGIPVSLLRYVAEKDSFKSTNGELKRIADIDAAEESLLGAWTGKEWEFKKDSEFVTTREHFALGKFKEGEKGVIIYRLQEKTSELSLADATVMIRFNLLKKEK